MNAMTGNEANAGLDQRVNFQAEKIYLVPRLPHPRADGDEPDSTCCYQEL